MGFVLPLVVLWAVPIGALVVASPLSHRAERDSVAPQVPEFVTIGARSAPGRHAVAVQVGFGEPADVAVRRAGVVTAIDVTVGTMLAAGTPFVHINGVPVLTYPGDTPFFRDLKPGDSGADVQALGRFLGELGLLPAADVSTTYGTAMQQAVGLLQRKVLGVATTGRFSVGYVAFVPSSATIVKSVKKTLGQDISPGEAMLTVSGAPHEINLLDPSNAQPPAVTGAVSLQAGDQQFPLPSVRVPAAKIAEVYAFLGKAATAGTVGRHDVHPAGDVAPFVPTEQFDGVVVVETAPTDTGTVPATAVYTMPGGRSCVFLRSATGYAAQLLSSVDLVRGQLGVVSVPASLTGKDVVRNPTSLDKAVRDTCA